MSALAEALHKAAADTGLSDDDDEQPTNTGGAGDKPPKDNKKVDADDADDDNDGADGNENDDDTSDVDDETQAAIDFYKRMTDPAQAPALLESIAKKAGFEFKKLDKQEVDAVAQEIESVFQEILGEEAAILPSNLAKAIAKIVDMRSAAQSEKITKLEEQIRAREEAEWTVKVDNALTAIADKYPDFTDEKLQKKIFREMQEFPPKPGANLEKYLEKIYKLAGGNGKQPSKTDLSNRVKSNKEGTKPSDGVRPERSTKPVNSLREAIELAMDEIEKD